MPRAVYTLREDLWAALNGGEPLALRDNLVILFMRGSLYPDDFGRDTKRALHLSRARASAAVVMTTFERTDILVNGRIVRQYGLRDWQTRFDELTGIFHADKGRVPAPLSENEEEARLEELVRAAFQPLAEAFRAGEIVRVLKKNPPRPDLHACAVQTLAYLIFLRACEETYPFERNFLRRIQWAYSGDGREAYGDVALTGVIAADINRIIRGMGEAAVLRPYLGYKFPDGALRRKLWTMGDSIKNETIHPALELLVTERFGLLRAIHFGAVLGRLLKRVRENSIKQDESTEGGVLRVRDSGGERRMTIASLREFLEEEFSLRIQPAIEARDGEAIGKTAQWAMGLEIEEKHSGGPILIAQAAEALTDFHARLHEAQTRLRAEMQQRAGHLFAEEESGSLGRSISPDRNEDDGGPYWRLCERGILRADYATYEDAELAELALNILNVLHAARSARHPRLVKAVHLRYYIGRYFAAPGADADSLTRDDRIRDDVDEAEESAVTESEFSTSAT